MAAQRTVPQPSVDVDSPWVAAMVRYVLRCGRTRVGTHAQRIIDLTRRIESATDDSDRIACRLRRAECWAALAAAADQSDPAGQLCALACRGAAALDRGVEVR